MLEHVKHVEHAIMLSMEHVKHVEQSIMLSMVHVKHVILEPMEHAVPGRASRSH